MGVELTKHQIHAFKEIVDNLHFEKKALLSGIAGVGKDFTTARIIEKYIKEGKSVWATATTHKALEVMEKNLSSYIDESRLSTIHSFLNLIPDKTKQNAPMVKNLRGKIKDTKLLVINEFSMLTSDVIVWLKEWMLSHPFSEVLFVGDASQLILSNDDIKELELNKVTSYLTEPMRQGKMSDIAMYSKMASEYILGKGLEPAIPWGDEVIKYENHTDFINAWKKSKTNNKVILAYKNATVKTYNHNILKHYRKQKYEYEPGNRVTLRSIVMTTDGQMIPNRRTVTLSYVNDKGNYFEVNSDYGEFRINKTARWLNDITDKYKQDMNWSVYYSVREKYVQVHHADAMTVHASQGSTFDTVFIDASDIMTAKEHVLRLAYVGISRARDTVHIFVGDKRNYNAFKPTIKDLGLEE